MDNRKESSDGEDIPSDFFDEFSKDEFIEGLSVIDSWDDEDKKPSSSRPQIQIDRDRDLRELIDRESQEAKRDQVNYEDRVKWRRNIQEPAYQKHSSDTKREGSMTHLDDYIKPGSRRDPSKTNEAIKKDKEEKVKEFLAKHLESGEELRPPGTELDDYFEENKSVEVRKYKTAERKFASPSPPRRHRMSPVKYRRESPTRRRESPPPYKYHRKPWSPRPQLYMSRRSPQRSFRNYIPHKPYRNYHHSSPRRRSPQVRRDRRSRSPYKRVHRRSRSRSTDRRHEREVHRRSHSRSSNHMSGKDDFLYPKSYPFPNATEYSSTSTAPYQVTPAPQYAESAPVEYPYSETQAPSYSYAPGPAYGGYGASYEYEQPNTMVMPVPQPVPAPVMASTIDPSIANPIQQPTMVPPPQEMTSVMNMAADTIENTPTDALAKLVADGKLSHEDYLKLAPNKGAPLVMDTQTKVAVLNRCHNAMSRLGFISLPNRLLINNVFVGNGQKQIVSKFCSPLKRQAISDFCFTKFNPSAIAQHNKQIVDSIVAALDIEKFVGRSKKKPQKDTKEVAVQTTQPFCEMCEIRESTKCSDVGTSIDRENITSTVHTQVVEQDLYSSRAVFNPTGGPAEGANMSIAHMTPAQLVSQLAARAKTLKQSEPPQNQYRHDSRYDYDGRGDQYRNYNNYRY